MNLEITVTLSATARTADIDRVAGGAAAVLFAQDAPTNALVQVLLAAGKHPSHRGGIQSCITVTARLRDDRRFRRRRAETVHAAAYAGAGRSSDSDVVVLTVLLLKTDERLTGTRNLINAFVMVGLLRNTVGVDRGDTGDVRHIAAVRLAAAIARGGGSGTSECTRGSPGYWRIAGRT